MGKRNTCCLLYTSNLLKEENGFSTMDMMIHHALTGEMNEPDLAKVAKPDFDHVYCTLSLLGRPGHVEKVIGVEELRKLPEIVDVSPWYYGCLLYTSKIQLSPTIQATKSNFTQKHGGKKPKYLDYFINAADYEIIVDQIQSEQSSRFYKKRNRNIIIKVDEDLSLIHISLPNYIVKLDHVKLEIGKHVKPTLILFFPQIAVSIYTVLDRTMIEVLTGNTEEIGYYEQAQKIVKLALTIVTSLGTDVYKRQFDIHCNANLQWRKLYSRNN